MCDEKLIVINLNSQLSLSFPCLILEFEKKNKRRIIKGNKK